MALWHTSYAAFTIKYCNVLIIKSMVQLTPSSTLLNVGLKKKGFLCGWWAHEHNTSHTHSSSYLQQLQGELLLSPYESKAPPLNSHSIFLHSMYAHKSETLKMKNIENDFYNSRELLNTRHYLPGVNIETGKFAECQSDGEEAEGTR